MVNRTIHLGKTPLVSAVVAGNGVNFSGTAQLIRGGTLTATDSKVGILSFWYKSHEDGNFQIILEDTDHIIQIFKDTGESLVFSLHNVSTTSTLSAGTSGGMTVAAGWVHIVLSWDCVNSLLVVVFNGTDLGVSFSGSNNNTSWSSPAEWYFGARGAGQTIPMKADIADFYLNTATYLDLSNSANVHKFRSAGGAPVDLGSDGSTPTGSAPTIFFAGTAATWNANKGTGGGFTVNTGSLTDASTDPP